MSSPKKSWTDSVHALVQALPRTFTTSDAYGHERKLRRSHPDNQNIRAKIRQQLQVLRDKGVLRQGAQRGTWERVGK